MTVAVCVKWLTPAGGDDRFGGISPADQAALECALRLGEARGVPVRVVTLGPAAADAALRLALACGAAEAVRVDAPVHLDSFDVAEALAPLLTDAAVVCCGDYSTDRGTGSVPAFLAGLLGARQALGLIAVEIGATHLVGTRRLDGGRRERVRVSAPAVVSVEGAVFGLRRAPLSRTLVADRLPVSVRPGPVLEHRPAAVRPYRPRARVLPAPAGATALERISAILSSGAGVVTHGDVVHLDPAAAAERILAALQEWGYLP